MDPLAQVPPQLRGYIAPLLLMKCTHLNLGDGMQAIVCGGRRVHTCACGRPSTKLCDWKIGRGRTCDKRLCDECAYSPAPEKDLCPTHAEAWKRHPKNTEAK